MRARATTLVAFDYGERRIGVAVGQTVTATATPFGTVRSVGSHPDWKTIERVIAQWSPEALVVGLPLNMDGTEQPLTARVRRFAHQLEGRFRLRVHLVDERLTTREAAERIARTGHPRAGRDAVAAQVILEDWLAAHAAVDGAAAGA